MNAYSVIYKQKLMPAQGGGVTGAWELWRAQGNLQQHCWLMAI